MSDHEAERGRALAPRSWGTFNDRGFFELLVADTSHGHLDTSIFLEVETTSGPISKLKDVPWEVAVDPSAPVRVASAGTSMGALRIVWIARLEAGALHALSIFHDEPVVVSVGADDTLVDPAVALPDTTMVQLVFRRAGAGSTLLRHVLSGNLGEKVSARTETLLAIPGEPRLSRAEAGTGPRAGHIALAWVEARDEGFTVCAAWLHGAAVTKLERPVERGLEPVVPQVLGISGVVPDRILVAWVGAAPDGTCHTVQNTFDFAETKSSVRVTPLGIVADELRSTHCLLMKAEVPSAPLVYLTGPDGETLVSRTDGRAPTPRAASPSPAHARSLIATRDNLFEVGAGADGAIVVAPAR